MCPPSRSSISCGKEPQASGGDPLWALEGSNRKPSPEAAGKVRRTARAALPCASLCPANRLQCHRRQPGHCPPLQDHVLGRHWRQSVGHHPHDWPSDSRKCPGLMQKRTCLPLCRTSNRIVVRTRNYLYSQFFPLFTPPISIARQAQQLSQAIRTSSLATVSSPQEGKLTFTRTTSQACTSVSSPLHLLGQGSSIPSVRPFLLVLLTRTNSTNYGCRPDSCRHQRRCRPRRC